MDWTPPNFPNRAAGQRLQNPALNNAHLLALFFLASFSHRRRKSVSWSHVRRQRAMILQNSTTVMQHWPSTKINKHSVLLSWLSWLHRPRHSSFVLTFDVSSWVVLPGERHPPWSSIMVIFCVGGGDSLLSPPVSDDIGLEECLRMANLSTGSQMMFIIPEHRARFGSSSDLQAEDTRSELNAEAKIPDGLASILSLKCYPFLRA